MKLLFSVAFVTGLLVSPDTMSDGLRQLIVTLFGLIAAGILPAMSLLASATYPTSYSVRRIVDFDAEVGHLLDRLKATLAFLIAGGLFVLISQIGLPTWDPQLALSRGYLIQVDDLGGRIIQAAILACFVVSLDRLRFVSLAFKRVRRTQLEMAIEEARRRLESNAPDTETTRSMFPTSPSHGERVALTAVSQRT